MTADSAASRTKAGTVYLEEWVTPRIPDTRPDALTVYLDQWVWIELAKAYYGKSEVWREPLEAVIASTGAGSARFPLSASHLGELAKQPDDASRARLADFMTRVWKGDAIRPYFEMFDPEAENAVRIMMGKRPRDLTSFVFGKGIPHSLGRVPALVSKHEDAKPLPPDVLRQIADMSVSTNLLGILKDPDLADAIRRTIERGQDFLSQMQSNIDVAYAHPDKVKRKDIAEARFLVTVTAGPLERAIVKSGSDPQALLAALTSSREQIAAVRRIMPTVHTFWVLDHARNMSRRIREGDIEDLALSIAIPYCDVVVTERSWSAFAKAAGLDDLYETRIVHTPARLAEILRAHRTRER